MLKVPQLVRVSIRTNSWLSELGGFTFNPVRVVWASGLTSGFVGSRYSVHRQQCSGFFAGQGSDENWRTSVGWWQIVWTVFPPLFSEVVEILVWFFTVSTLIFPSQKNDIEKCGVHWKRFIGLYVCTEFFSKYTILILVAFIFSHEGNFCSMLATKLQAY